MLVSKELLTDICREARKNNLKVVFTNGCFDVLHAGHAIYLAEAKKLGDLLVVGLNTDSSVRKLKGESRPINNENDRAIVLSALKSVDYVCLFDEETPFNLIETCLPDYLVKGGDYSIESIVGADIVIDNGGKVLTIPLVEGKSSTNIINKIND